MKDLITLGQHLFAWTWKTSVQAALLIVLVLLLQKLLARWLTPRLRYALSLLILCRLLLPAAPPSSLSLENLLVSAAQVAAPGGAAPMVAEPTRAALPAASRAAPPLDAAASSHRPSRSIGEVLGLGWVSGLLLLVLLAGWRYAKWHRLIRQGRRPDDARLLELLDGAREVMGVGRPVTLMAVARLSSPAVFGLWRVRLLLPEAVLGQLSDQELRLVFLHEMAHVRRQDVLLNLLLVAVQFLHWFNPLVWLGLRRLRADRELVCDAMVVQRLEPAEWPGYGRLLIKLLEGFSAANRVFPSAVPVIGSKHEFKRRILLIKHHRNSSWRACLATALVAVGLGCATFTGSGKQSPALNPAPLPAPMAGNARVRQSLVLVVNIDAQGKITLGQTPVTVEELKNRLMSEVAKNPELSLVVGVDKNVSLKKVVTVWDATQAAGVRRVSLRISNGDTRRETARDFYEEAMTHYSAHEYQAELADLNQALELDPNHTEALFSRGCLYDGGLPMVGRDYAKAVADYSRLLDLDPRDCSALHNRARCYEQLRQPDKALADYTRIIEGDTDFSRVSKEKQLALDHHYRGRVYQENKKDYARAVADYNEALRLDPERAKPGADSCRIVLRRGQAYQALKEYGKAQEDYARYQEIAPIGELWLCWAWQLATASDAKYRDGAKAIEFAAKGDQNLEVLAAAYAEHGDFSKAVETQEKVIADLDAGKKPSGTPLSFYGFAKDSRAAMAARLALYKAGRPFHGD